MNEICKMAVDTYGKESQINQAIEKISELMVAINRWRRGRATKGDVLNEIAEVVIMLHQLCYIIYEKENGNEICNELITKKLEQLEWVIKWDIKCRESANTQKS